MLTVALIFGGRSAEHEISLSSARFVADNLDPARYDIVPVGILRNGAWVLPRDLRCALRDGLEAAPCDPVALLPDPTRPGLETASGARIPLDFAFPILHGTYGEDGTIQGLLEMAGLPYAGAGVLGSSVGMDKELMKAAFCVWGLPQVHYLVLRDAADRLEEGAGRVEAGFEYPVFVKPANLGSSVGMTKAHDRGELLPALELAFRYDRKVIVEEHVDGRELECAVLGNERPQASVPGEVVPANEYYDYEAKYTDGMMSFRIPAPLPEATVQRVRELAEQAFRAIDCSGFARCDFFVRGTDGEVLVNEINTIPGMTSMSAFPRLWEATGVGSEALVDRIVGLGLERHAVRGRLSVSR
jgi:D-alanine-D-alanine ligase